MIEAVIFDIDGTLIDSNDAHAETWVRAFDKYGKTISFAEAQKVIGMGADRVLEKYLSKIEVEEFGDELTKFRSQLFLDEYLPRIKTFPKVRELFEKLQSDGKKIALASSAKKDEIEKYKKLMNISDLLDEETSSDDAEESKPAPDIFQAALEKLGRIKKDKVLVIGDTPYDAQAAVKAELKIIGVQSGGWTREKLLEEGCFKVYRDISEIYQDYDNSVCK